MRKRNNYQRNAIEKEINCSCGSKAKLCSRRNYPFGKKSKSVRTMFYRCKKCGKILMLDKKEDGGKRR